LRWFWKIDFHIRVKGKREKAERPQEVQRKVNNNGGTSWKRRKRGASPTKIQPPPKNWIGVAGILIPMWRKPEGW
jgi:hypothetical protein